METAVSTFATVERPGVYTCSNCGDNQVTLEAGDKAPGCCNCDNRPVTWFFVRPLGQRPIGFVIP
jgi:hypothetical protein